MILSFWKKKDFLFLMDFLSFSLLTVCSCCPYSNLAFICFSLLVSFKTSEAIGVLLAKQLYGKILYVLKFKMIYFIHLGHVSCPTGKLYSQFALIPMQSKIHSCHE